MLIREIGVEDIKIARFNSRTRYSSKSIKELSRSLASNGQLSPICVRPSATLPGKYEIVFGHRRFFAAKSLGWNTIRTEIVEASDREIMQRSAIENLQREDISDFEKAMIFERLNNEFELSYHEIGEIVGFTKQTVSNYISMLRLFSQEELSSNAELVDCLHLLKEHHSRVLLRIEDRKTRCDLALMATRKNLSVRELINIVSHLRSWFPKKESHPTELLPDEIGNVFNGRLDKKKKQVLEAVMDMFRLGRCGDFENYKQKHMFSEGFSLFPSYPAARLYEGDEAFRQEQLWFSSKLKESAFSIDDVRIQIMGDTALCILAVSYPHINQHVRGSVVLLRREGLWKILHEHWSKEEIDVQQSDHINLIQNKA